MTYHYPCTYAVETDGHMIVMCSEPAAPREWTADTLTVSHPLCADHQWMVCDDVSGVA